MKKRNILLILMLITAIIINTGCTAKNPDDNNEKKENAPIVISGDAADILEHYGIKQSKITDIDFAEIEKNSIKLSYTKESVIGEEIRNTLSMDYTENEKNTPTVEPEDAVIIDLCIKDSNGQEMYSDENILVMVGYGLFDKAVEEKLVGRNKGDSIEISSNDLQNEAFSKFNGMTAVIELENLIEFEIKGEGGIKKFERLGLNSFKDVYEYNYKIKKSEHEFIDKQNIEIEFFRIAKKYSNFELNKEEIANYSEILSNNQDDEFLSQPKYLFQMGINGEGALKKVLISGALAEKYGIKLDEKEYLEFCEKCGFDENDTENRILAKAFMLKNAVVSYFFDNVD